MSRKALIGKAFDDAMECAQMLAAKRKIVLVAAAAALAFAGAAAAQEAPATTTSATVAAPQTSESLDLARRYFTAIGFEGELGAILARLTTPEQLGARKELSPAERDAIVSAAAEAMDEAMPLILDEAAQITASTFTPAQLREMIAFYETDSGKAIAAKTSILPPMASQLVLSFAPILRADVVLRACAKMDCEAAPPLKV